jgi:nitrogen fixation/metabolism regulation signal transduction histidine kinase
VSRTSVRWTWSVAVVAVTGVAMVLGFVLSFGSTSGGGFYEKQFVWLFWLNVAVAALLVLVLVVAAVRLAVRLRRGKFGSRLLLKLAGIFALVGLLPGLVIYAVSYQFAARSIEAWFDVRLAGALDAGLALGKTTLDTLQTDLVAKTAVAAGRVSELRDGVTPLELERMREQIGASDLVLISASGQAILAVGSGAGALASERPSPVLLRLARASGRASQIDGLEDEQAARAGSARVRALVALPSIDFALKAAPDRFLLGVQPVPSALAANALAVQAAYSEYQQRALARDGLRRMYIGTLTLALILAVFGAVLLAMTLGNQIARPLLLLADGVREVAAGNLSAKPVFASGDELGGLTRSFADMTQQVADARQAVQRGASQLQTILDNLTAGVVLFDTHGRIDSANPAATRILRQPLQAYAGRRLDDIPGLQPFAQGVAQRFETLASAPEPGERGQWQESFELHGASPADTTTLIARGATLPGDARLLVFDDITEVVSAQRAQAWAEVARRLAHEIKNPLTPIQLSAERLQHRLESKLEGPDQAMLVRSVATIVAQVQSMKDLVNEFRDYARLPAAQLLPLDVNTLANEVLGLYAHAHEEGRLTAQLEQGLPQILGDASQLRQVIHNLVQNALDAVEGRPDGHVSLVTEAVRGEAGDVRGVRLAVVDNGHGFADHVLKRAFEPYVTTKTKGTGLGLAVVKKIADEHRARVRLINLRSGPGDDAPVTGARVSLSFSLLHLQLEGPEPRAA